MIYLCIFIQENALLIIIWIVLSLRFNDQLINSSSDDDP